MLKGRGPYKINKDLYTKARELRAQGQSYGVICKTLNVKKGTVERWIKDIDITIIDARLTLRKTATWRTTKSTVTLQRRTDICKFLSKLYGYKCSECGISEWRGKRLGLQVEHINGNKHDNRDENLTLLCPNCHSQTPTWCGRNVKLLRKRATSEQAQRQDLKS